MDCGDELRKKTKSSEVLSLLAISKLTALRLTSEKDSRVAYIFKSLKNPAEAKMLRDTYRSSFFLISVYSSRDLRIENLSKKIAKSRHKNNPEEFHSKAVDLIQRDEFEKSTKKFGQNVRDTFSQADIFVDASELHGYEKIHSSLKRFVELIFGNTFHTPTDDEFGMFTAFASAKRSGSWARQVGAVVTNENGDIISSGMNEIPKIGGGLYTADIRPDQRNLNLGYDSNDQKKYQILIDLLERLQQIGLLKKQEVDISIEDLLKSIKNQLQDTYILDLIEFSREVHAEMAALISAARNTVTVNGCTFTRQLFHVTIVLNI